MSSIIKEIVSQVLAEAKKKKKSKKDGDEPVYEALPAGYGYAQAFDFAPPLGEDNLYRRQGGSSWGPMTSAGTKLEDTNLNALNTERALRAKIKEEIKEQISNSWSAWDVLSEITVKKEQPKAESSSWEAALKLVE
jgi:hypothetical protein